MWRWRSRGWSTWRMCQSHTMERSRTGASTNWGRPQGAVALSRARGAARARRYTDATPMRMKLLEPLTNAGGFKVDTDWMPRGVPDGALTIEFSASAPPRHTRRPAEAAAADGTRVRSRGAPRTRTRRAGPPMVTRVVTEFPDGSLQVLVFMCARPRPPAAHACGVRMRRHRRRACACGWPLRAAGSCPRRRARAGSSARRCWFAPSAARGCPPLASTWCCRSRSTCATPSSASRWRRTSCCCMRRIASCAPRASAPGAARPGPIPRLRRRSAIWR